MTRVTSSSATVLDHIITNENKHQILPVVIDYDITDHYPVAALVHTYLAPKDNKQIRFSRSFAKFNGDDFNNDLQEKIDDFMPSILNISENNLNDKFIKFYSLLTSTVDAHAPLKRLSRIKSV